jgi:hypothetical protein
MEIDPKLVILVISNQLNGQELFRVHIHEFSIRFDQKFQEGIENNYELRKEIDYLNDLWKSQKIKQSEIFPIMLDIMVRHGDYLKNFFFDLSELDKDGQFIEKPKYEIEPTAFFKSLNKQKLLKKLRKKDFQENIKNIEVANKYVEILEPKLSYYYYQHFRNAPLKENWFFVSKNDNLILCFKNK